MLARRAIMWFRQDLRLHDNEALQEALGAAQEVIPVYVFDERIFMGRTPYGFKKTGKYRAQFIIESVRELRESLRALNSDLIVRVGKPEEIIYKLADQAKSSWVFCNRERTRMKVTVQDALEKNLWSIGQELRFSRGKMLYYTADLPFPVTHTPDSFAQFRKEVERYLNIREPFPAPSKPFTPLTVAIDSGEIPSLNDFGHPDLEPDPRAAIDFKGGEQEGLKRLDRFLWETNAVQNYHHTQNELCGEHQSTKFSAWLAQGCLSPKRIYQELKKYEAARGGEKSVYQIFYGLMWRDFLRFMAKKHGDVIFEEGGIKGTETLPLKEDYDLFKKWIDGKTGVPLIDANMREIKHTGYMSNRGRQNVSSFLVNDLKVSWRMGADYFESILIDYDPASNYGNWNMVGGVGSDPKENRYFNILSQAKKYDPDGAYVKKWIPELEGVPTDKIHQPDQLSSQEQEAHHIRIGDDYPPALVSLD
jgi:deoxyribodipyrimidine photo-lyase